MSDITLSLFVDALQSGALKLDLSPIVTAEEHDIFAFEGVLRSDQPGFDDPARVVQAASEYNMVDELADRVYAQARIWLDRLPERILFVLDLHPFEAVDTDAVMARLASLGEPRSRVVVRLPHPGMLLDIPNCDETLRRVHEAGYRIAVGNAASAFRVLPFAVRVPVAIVEVEPGFADGAPEDEARLQLFDRIVKYADKVEAKVLVHGISSTRSLEVLRDRGADLFAGEIFEVEYGSEE